MIRIPLTSLALIFAIASSGCVSLSFDDDEEPAAPPGNVSKSTVLTQDLTPTPEATSSARVRNVDAAEGLRWNDLTKLAREHQTRGESEQAQRRLDQAALLTSGLRPTHAARRAVFGIRARFAETLAAAGEIERADLLADELLTDAKAEPALSGAALISLAKSVSGRRTIAARRQALEEAPDAIPDRVSRTPLLRIAFRTAQLRGRADRERVGLAFELSREAYWDGDFEIARESIEQAIADVQILKPGASVDRASLMLQRARVAMAQGDFTQAIADGTEIDQIFEEVYLPASLRGQGKAILARALAERGDTDRAVVIARDGYSRLVGEEPLDSYTRRQVISALARVEAVLGNKGQARRYYDEAVEVPVQDSFADRRFLDELRVERSAFLTPR